VTTDWTSIVSVKRHLQSQEQTTSATLDLADTVSRLGDLYLIEGNYLEAEPLYWRALEIRQKLLGENHKDVAASLKNLAELYEIQDRYAEAERFYLWAASTLKRSKLQEHSDHVDQTQKIGTPVPNVAALRGGGYCKLCQRPLLDSVVCLYCTLTGFNAAEVLEKAGIKANSTGASANCLIDMKTESVYRLEEVLITIGRHPSNTIILRDDKFVSRYHSQVCFEKGRFFLRDKLVSNSTLVNGEPLSGGHELVVGDVITIGGTSFVADFRS